MPPRTLLLSLHDVTPRHTERLARAETLFRDLGVTRVTYLLVPRYHRRWSIDEDPEFSRWCRAPRPFDVRWCLHGYHHEESGTPDARPSPGTWFKRRFLTDGEGEFLTLSGASARDRIDRGRKAFTSCLGLDPAGFVAPAWLFNETLMPALAERGFTWTEDHWRIYDLQRRTAVDAPVITWASRTRARRWGSIWLAPRLQQRWHAKPILRIAVHPSDFDYTSIVEALVQTISAALRDRTLETYEHTLTCARTCGYAAIVS